MSDRYKYASMQKGEYNENSHFMINNHKEHNDNPDYWNILLKPIDDNKGVLQNTLALDFGCGHGRNVINMLNKNIFSGVDGVDICDNHLGFFYDRIKETGHEGKSRYYVNNGVDLSILESETYSFVLSTIALQHICVYETRFSLLSDIHRVLKPGGILSFQMGFGEGHPSAHAYHANIYEAHGTNSQNDVKVIDPQYIVDDLRRIGFNEIQYEIKNSFSDRHNQWIYVQCKK